MVSVRWSLLVIFALAVFGAAAGQQQSVGNEQQNQPQQQQQQQQQPQPQQQQPQQQQGAAPLVRDFIQQSNPPLCNFTQSERDTLRQKVQNFQSTGASISDLSPQQRDAARQRFENSILSRCRVDRDALNDWERRFPGETNAYIKANVQ